MGVNPQFWRDKRVFITGHTGFKGSWLTLWLQKLGAKVTGYALPASGTQNLFTKACVGDCIQSILGDVRDQQALQVAIMDAQPQVVFHMAAQALVRESYIDPIGTYGTNVMGTAHLFEALRQVPGVRAVVNVTTDKCYENREWVWGYRENEALGGYDPYSSSKACSELVTAAFRNSFFNPVKYESHGLAIATARAGNVIGGGDYAPDRLIPDIVAAFAEGRSVPLRSPHAVRPWQHVLEPLQGYLALAQHLYQDGPPYGESWNLGPRLEDTQQVQWIAERMAKLWGDNATWHLDGASHPHEAHTLRLDISKARGRLNWQPALDLSQTLAWVVQWYKEESCGADAKALTLTQISAYEALLQQTQPYGNDKNSSAAYPNS